MGTADLKDSKQQLVDAFIEVMQCSGMEAEFYLESSMMDIATAISLCMDVKKEGERFEHTGAYRSSNNGSDNHGKRHRGDSDSSISAKYTGRQLDIGGNCILTYYVFRLHLHLHLHLHLFHALISFIFFLLIMTTSLQTFLTAGLHMLINTQAKLFFCIIVVESVNTQCLLDMTIFPIIKWILIK